MKRSTLTRRTPLGAGKGPRASAKLRRGSAIKPVNRKRKADRYTRDFGDEAAAVRLMPCLITGGPAVPAHVVSRGAGGGRFDIVPLSQAMHDQQHSVGIESFQGAHGLDLRAEADRIAAAHEVPLGLRGVGRAWANDQTSVTGYDLDALFGWVRRRADREPEIHEKLCAVSDDLHVHVADADALCNAAGVDGWLTIEQARAWAQHWADRRSEGRTPEFTPYEFQALLGWVRRLMERTAEAHDSWEPVDEAIATALIDAFESSEPWVGELGELAGWPS